MPISLAVKWRFGLYELKLSERKLHQQCTKADGKLFLPTKLEKEGGLESVWRRGLPSRQKGFLQDKDLGRKYILLAKMLKHTFTYTHTHGKEGI